MALSVNGGVGSKGGGSNPNLLDNGWFTVNQRNGYITKSPSVVYYQYPNLTSSGGAIGYIISSKEQQLKKYDNTAWSWVASSGTTYYVSADDVVSGYVGNGYTVDRWTSQMADVLKVDENGIIYSTQLSTSPYKLLAQILDDDISRALRGKTVTLSIKYADGHIDSHTYEIPTADFDWQPSGTYDGARIGLYCSAQYTSNRIWVRIIGETTESHIRAVKLEYGSISTLALDSAPNYTTELLKCQRYYYCIRMANNTTRTVGVGHFSGSDSARVFIPCPTEFRAKPTVVKTGDVILISNGTTYLWNSVSVSSDKDNIVGLVISTGAGQGNTPVLLRMSKITDVLEFSADL